MFIRHSKMCINRTERGGGGEDARAAVPDQQVNSGSPRYPVDRYLVERSNQLEMVNITDDIWNADPALRPEDEIVLRKLHDMLQSTADDLKLLSGELSKYHEPGVQVKSLPTPLDEDFNEKVHIEELVNAKFHGYQIVNKPLPTSANMQRGKVDGILKSADTCKPKKVIDTGVQVNQVPIIRKPVRKNNLTVSRTRVIQIDENAKDLLSGNEENSSRHIEKGIKPTVAYKEFSFKYTEPNTKVISENPLKVQNMPSINIRSELKEQKVLQLNIEPNAMDNDQDDIRKSNVGVISVRHEPISVPKTVPTTNLNQVQHPFVPTTPCNKEPNRKFSKMSSCESSENDSYPNINSTIRGFRKPRIYRAPKTAVKLPVRPQTEYIKNKRNISSKKEPVKQLNSNLDLWKKKLNAVYGPSSSRKPKLPRPVKTAKKVETKSNSPSSSQPMKTENKLNNAEYIPYSKLTLGGVRVSDIEKELSGIANKNDVTLGPILNRILSRENSFDNESPRVDRGEESPKILTTSDENLLREVLDIERKVNKTLNKKNIDHKAPDEDRPTNNEEHDSYADDFEDEKSDYSYHSKNQNQLSDVAPSTDNSLEKLHDSDTNNDIENRPFKSEGRKENIQNKTFTKTLNLSFKKNVDVFEFVHNIDTQDTGTQSNTTQKISLKETQTSPRNDKCNVQPIHNDLWPSIDPKGEVEKLFQLEKDFIKKLIIDEYGDLLEKNLNKPSTSRVNQSIDERNVTASQKNTQTSPAHVKNVMTSPARTKTRTTSPFALSLSVDQQTSPMKELKVNIEDGDDLGISINLSSPRFSLRLPQTSHEVISNLESHVQSNRNTHSNDSRETRLARRKAVSSTSSADGDYSSSDVSSVGEVRLQLRKLRKLKLPDLSELSSSTSLSKHSSDISDAIIPLRSEGEVSFGQVNVRKSKKNVKSEGEASLGGLR